MRRIKSTVDTTAAQFLTYDAHNRNLLETFRKRQHAARNERPQRVIDRLRSYKKLLPRERLDRVLDPGTPFLELATLAANSAYDGEVPGAGMIGGIGLINGREIMITAADSTVKAGAWYPLTVKKNLRCLEIALENRLPVLHLVDSAGAYLPLQSELFADKYGGGRGFRLQCALSKHGIPQVAIAFGHCTAGGAYVPTLSDYSIIVRGTGGVFLGGPPLVKAATGEEVSAEDLGGADVHASISGTSDYAVDSEDEALALAREIIGTLAQPVKQCIDQREPEVPYYDPDELYGIIPDAIKQQFDMREVIARIVDGSRFHEFKPDYGTTLVCGYAWLCGYKVGILGNNGVLFSDSAKKATTFMQLCNRDGVPVIFLQNTTGFMVGREYERGGITKDGAKMLMTQANLDVPKFTVIVNGSFGAGNYAMCGRAYDARFMFTWPNSQISVMGMEQAAKTLTQIRMAALQREGRQLSDAEAARIRAEITEDYEFRSTAYYATSELWDDGIIDPVDTRAVLGMAISASLNAPFQSATHLGVLRV